jgi:hypothetical protein
MTPSTSLVLTTIEVAQLNALVQDFVALVDEGGDGRDPGLDRLTPDAYPDDPRAAEDFRGVTRADLLARRTDDAGVVLRALASTGGPAEVVALDEQDAVLPRTVDLDADDAAAWMRTLTAIRLVLASRLGIVTEDDADPDDPRYFLYEWLGATLDRVVSAASDLL